MRFLIVLSMLFPLIGCQRNNDPADKGALVLYEYRLSHMRASPAEYYRLERTEDGMQLLWSKNASDGTILRVSEDALERVNALMQEYKLYRLKENYRPLGHVLDGEMWTVRFRYEKGSVSSSGDNAWPPEKLLNGIKAIHAYLKTLIEASTEADIIGTVAYRDL